MRDGAKHIDLQALRNSENKPARQVGGDRKRDNKKPFKKGGRRDDRSKVRVNDKKDPQAAKDQLDREMETYWLKSGNKEQGKQRIKTNNVFNYSDQEAGRWFG